MFYSNKIRNKNLVIFCDKKTMKRLKNKIKIFLLQDMKI